MLFVIMKKPSLIVGIVIAIILLLAIFSYSWSLGKVDEVAMLSNHIEVLEGSAEVKKADQTDFTQVNGTSTKVEVGDTVKASSGAVIVEHTCYSCDLSDLHTEFFSNYSQNHNCFCDHKTTSLPSWDENSFKSVCCTFNFEKLSLTEYNLNTLIDFSVVSTPVLSHLYISSDYQQEKPVCPIIIHNKHGGRDILRSACQLII